MFNRVLLNLFQVIHLSKSFSQPQGPTPYIMEEVQLFKTSGGTHTIYISSEVTSEPESSVKNEYQMSPLNIKEEPLANYQVAQGIKRKHEDR